MPAGSDIIPTTFPLPRVVPCEGCREQRKRCIRSWHSKKCERCTKRRISCSYENEQGPVKIGDAQEFEAFVNLLKSLESLEQDIKAGETELLQAQSRPQPQPQSQLQLQARVSNSGTSSSAANWELTMQSSKAQKVTLQFKLERTADLIEFVNYIYYDLVGYIPRQFPRPQSEPSVVIRIQRRQFPEALVQLLRDAMECDSLKQSLSFNIRMPTITICQSQMYLSLAHAYFGCRNCIEPLMHQEYYHQNVGNSIGAQLNLAIGCLTSVRNCVHSPFRKLPQYSLLEQASYFIVTCTEQVEEMMLLDQPPLTLPMLLLALSTSYLVLQNPQKAWLLTSTARAYLQQCLSKYITILSDRNMPSNAEVETYKFAIHYCKRADDHLTSIIHGRTSPPQILNIDPELLLPKMLENDDPVQNSIQIEAYSWETLKNRAQSWLYSTHQQNGQDKTVDWKNVKDVNNQFSAWYRRLPRKLKIGDNPFDINAMEIPNDLHVGVCALNLQYYGEWVSVYGNFLSSANTAEPSDIEATVAECKHIAFLASQAIIKIAQHMTVAESCRIEFYWILFACEPLLHLINASDQHIANESRKTLQSALTILKAVMQHTFFYPNVKLGRDNDYPITLMHRLHDRITGLFSAYGIQF